MTLPRWHRWVAVALLTWVAGAGLYLAHRDSLTTDEGIHVASGYLILTRHDYRFDPEHPPLFKLVSALPLLPLALNPPPDDQHLWDAAAPTFYDSWREAREWTEQWFYRSGNDADRMVFLMRLPAVAALVLLCWLAWRLGRQWFGPKVGLLVLFFLACNPTVLGHGHLANDDVPLAAAALAVLGSITWYRSKPGLWRSLAVGGLLAVAVGTKLSGVILVVIASLLFAVEAWQRRSWRPLGHFLASLAVVYASIWAMYGFQSPLLPDRHLEELAQRAAPFRPLDADRILAATEILRYLLPTAFLKGVVLVQIVTAFGRGAYLFGHHFFPAVWYYFPALILLKTQLVGLLLVCAGLVLGLRRGFKKPISPAVQGIAAVLLVFGVTALTTKLQLGIRHIMPIIVLLPFAMAAAYLALASRYRAAWLLLALYALPALAQFPRMISFTNELVPYGQAYRLMNDSNLDWGQDAKAIAAYAADQPLANQYLWSPYALSYYGVRNLPLDMANPPHRTLIMLSSMNLSSKEGGAFRDLAPVHSIGNGTFFYWLP